MDTPSSFFYQQVEFQALALSPSSTETELQIVCFFDQMKNQAYAGGTAAVDEHFHGAIRLLRSENIFHDDRFETLLLTPRKNQIPAKKLLFIGLGDPDTFALDLFKVLGRIAAREAMKLEVTDFCFAPSLKDADVPIASPHEISARLAEGMKEAIDTSITLSERGLTPKIKLKKIFILAGVPHLAESQAGLQIALKP